MINPVCSSSSGADRVAGIRLCCPQCKGTVEAVREVEQEFICRRCAVSVASKDGVWNALLPERESHFAQFIEEYEAIRAAEGRGSSDSEYYLNLPFAEQSTALARQWKIRAATYETLRRQVFLSLTESKGSDIYVLDIGAGNGWLSYRLAKTGIRPVALDLLVNEFDGLGAAAHYDAVLSEPFPRFRAESDRLPFADNQFNAIVFNASFHYSENYGQTVSESLRCLRVGGSLVIADTPWYSCEKSGELMIAERQLHFLKRFGTPSNSLQSQEFLTDERLKQLSSLFGLKWSTYKPFYGIRWSLRPWFAKLRGQREPSRFRIYTTQKLA